MTIDILNFVRESNHIEGIRRDAFECEVAAHIILLEAPELTVDHLEDFAATVQPGARLRIEPTMNARLGDHIAPIGGPEIRVRLRKLLRLTPQTTPFHTYCAMQRLRPFTDGNGRTARAVWLRMMGGPEGAVGGFLQNFHWQALSSGDVQ